MSSAAYSTFPSLSQSIHNGRPTRVIPSKTASIGQSNLPGNSIRTAAPSSSAGTASSAGGRGGDLALGLAIGLGLSVMVLLLLFGSLCHGRYVLAKRRKFEQRTEGIRRVAPVGENQQATGGSNEMAVKEVV